MYTQYDVRDVKSMKVEKVEDMEKGVYFNYTIELDQFPGAIVPIDEKEFSRLTRSFNKRMRKGELIVA